ncbi:Gfo/Idh/MocA family oxidoreductase [bacterium]|nr:Gfo/Idh/MocA family oxidoreductase [bacterium]
MGRHHARVYSELDGINLAGVADPDEERGTEIANKYSAKYYRDYHDMLESEDIQAITIAAPTSLHKQIALDCISRGIDILIEKPIADTVDGGEEILKTAKEQGVFVFVGHIERFNPAIQKLKTMLDNGEVGTVTSLLARRVGPFPPQIKDANVILDIGVHDIDIFNYLLGKKVRRIFTSGGKALNSKREDFADIFLDYVGVGAFCQVNWITPIKLRQLFVTGTNGFIELDYITQKVKLYESVYAKEYDSFGDFIVKFGEPNTRDIPVETSEPLKMEINYFLNKVKKGEKSLSFAYETLYALSIALKAIQSLEGGRSIEFSE